MHVPPFFHRELRLVRGNILPEFCGSSPILPVQYFDRRTGGINIDTLLLISLDAYQREDQFIRLRLPCTLQFEQDTAGFLICSFALFKESLIKQKIYIQNLS